MLLFAPNFLEDTLSIFQRFYEMLSKLKSHIIFAGYKKISMWRTYTGRVWIAKKGICWEKKIMGWKNGRKDDPSLDETWLPDSIQSNSLSEYFFPFPFRERKESFFGWCQSAKIPYATVFLFAKLKCEDSIRYVSYAIFCKFLYIFHYFFNWIARTACL